MGQLYATEADPDGRLAPDTGEPESSLRQLRGYLIRHALFRGPLLVGDSQINNNPHLRELLWPGREREFPVRRDLSVLLEDGHLTPVVRQGRASLTEIHASQRERGVEGLPPAGYVEYLDAHRHDFGRGYDVGLLALQFRTQLLLQFSPANARCALASRERALVTRWINDQEVVYFDGLRAWATRSRDAGALSQADWDAIDDTAAVCYRYNVPLALGLATDYPQARDLRWGMIDLPLGGGIPGQRKGDQDQVSEVFELPFLALSLDRCATIPARLVTLLKSEPVHYRLRRAVSAYEAGKPVDSATLAGEFEGFIRLVRELLREEGQAEAPDARNARMVLRVERGAALGRFTLLPTRDGRRSADGQGYGSTAYGTTSTAMESSESLGVSQGSTAARQAPPAQPGAS